MLTETTFYYVRHGETDWNREKRVQGQLDIPLNALGMEQAEAASRLIRDLDIAAVCTSPLSRALETAKRFQTALGCSFHVIKDLREATFGTYDGEIRGAWYDEWKAGRFIPKGAETYPDFIQRALAAINRALAHPGPVLIVAHGVLYRAIKEHARLDEKFTLLNCQVVRHTPPLMADQSWQAVAIR
jgi:probable phosphoglycerate mutase